MAMVDQQGRLFGRLNLLDAAVVLFVFALIPLGYASWLIFRTPPARLTAIEPATTIAVPEARFLIHGANLRPFMRVSLGPHQGFDFLFRDSTEAEVIFRKLPPGVYDVILYDVEKERDRLPHALTITATPVPPAHLIAIGWLGSLTAAQVPRIKVGMTIEGIGEVTAIGRQGPQSTRVFSGSNSVEVKDLSTLRVPVAVRVGCDVRSREGFPVCSVGDIDLKAGALLMVPSAFGTLPFQVDQTQTSTPVEDVRVVVRFVNEPRLLAPLRKDDVDTVKTGNELAAGAQVLDIASPRPDMREVSLRVQAQRERDGWTFANELLRVGGRFAFRTSRYELTGMMLSLDPIAAPSAATPPTR